VSSLPISNIVEVNAVLFLNGPTQSVEAQTAILEALASQPETAPTHGGIDERKRLPFSVETLAAQTGKKLGGSPVVWRLTPPKYWGLVDSTPLPVARITMHYEKIAAKNVAPVVGAVARLADRLEPVYAALHFKWAEGTPEQLASLRTFWVKPLHYARYGPPGIFAWTWFGPALVESIGMPALLAQGAAATAWGGASLPLVESMWSAPFEALRERQIAVDAALRATGIFGDYSQPLPQKGANWSPPPLPSPGNA